MTGARLAQDRKGASSCPSRGRRCSGRSSTRRSLPGAWWRSLQAWRPSGRGSRSGSGIAESSGTCGARIPKRACLRSSTWRRQDLEPARPYVIEALRDPRGKVRVAACRVLANQGAELQRLIPVLSAAVDDENPEVRLEAAACLGRLSAHLARPGRHPTGESSEQETELAGESVAILCRLLKDSSSDVRAEAARSLALTSRGRFGRAAARGSGRRPGSRRAPGHRRSPVAAQRPG